MVTGVTNGEIRICAGIDHSPIHEFMELMTGSVAICAPSGIASNALIRGIHAFSAATPAFSPAREIHRAGTLTPQVARTERQKPSEHASKGESRQAAITTVLSDEYIPPSRFSHIPPKAMMLTPKERRTEAWGPTNATKRRRTASCTTNFHVFFRGVKRPMVINKIDICAPETAVRWAKDTVFMSLRIWALV